MLTLIYPYYENGGMLERHLREWEKYSAFVKKSLRVIIVDDGSPNDPAAGHMRDVGIKTELYRIKQNLVWNVAGARNLGMHAAPEGWCLVTDIDHLLEAPEAKKLAEFEPFLVTNFYYVPGRKWADGRPLHPHPNSYVIERAKYWETGGCDEDYTGWWGAGEGPFRRMLGTIATKVDAPFQLTHFGRSDIADASTREWGRRDSTFDWRNNPKLVRKARMGPYKAERPLRFEWEKVG